MPTRPTIEYQPALDGVRAVAVVAVLLFHGGVPGFEGGYLGVSVFFTLSGYLITSLLLQEHGGTGGIDLPGFYARRLRRLLPASTLCLSGVALLAAFTEVFDGVANLRTHLLGSLFQVANWVFLLGDGSYQDLLARTSGTVSPLEHFWSLAIEEQFYWVWPPFAALVLSRVPRWRGRMVVVGALTGAFALAAPVIAAVWGADAAYWATPARLSEILMGALLAVYLTGRPVPERIAPVAPLALGVLLVCIVLFPASGGPAYRGALPLVAVVSAALVMGLQAPGPLRRLLAVGGLVWIGRVSYGLYLFHWPVFVVLDADRVGVSGPALFTIRIVVTLVITVASYELLERPIRSGRRVAPGVTFSTAAMSTAAVFAIVMVSVPSGAGDYWNPDADLVEAASIEVSEAPLVAPLSAADPTRTGDGASDHAATNDGTVPADDPAAPLDPADDPAAAPVTSLDSTPAVVATPGTSPPTAAPPTTEPPIPELIRPVRIVVTGDSTAEALGTGLVQWAAANPDIAQVEVVSAPGCGFLRGGERRTGDTIAPIEGCDRWIDEFVYPTIRRAEPDVVVSMVSSWDIIDRRWDTEQLLTPLDADFRTRLVADYERLVDDAFDRGATRFAFVRHPIQDVYWLPAADAQEDPARHAVLYDTYDRLAASDERVDVVALDRWFSEQGLDRSEEARPDGIHLAPDAAASISAAYLGEALVRVALGLSVS